MSAPLQHQPVTAIRAALSDAQIDAIFDLHRMLKRDGDHDLMAIGAAAIGTPGPAFLRPS